MQLMAEFPTHRTYLGNDDETWYEVRKELMAKTYPLEERHYRAFEADPTRTVPNHPELKDTVMRCALALTAWFTDNVDFDPAGEQSVSYSSETYTNEDLARFKWDPSDFLPNTQYRIVMVDQAYWPPAPVDPDPDPQRRKPRKNDFRGDKNRDR
ncbi:hypothetical protein SEA_RASPUTIA_41 [Microbacterium phage Rasputia]|nr:hypothetical protein SEA_RASPUTIA_41 [Microbacterium phage Rasputia]